MRRAILILMALVLLWPAGVMGGVRYEDEASTDYTITLYSGTAVRAFSIMSYSEDIELILYLDSVALDTVTVLAQMVWEPTILCDELYVDRTGSTAVMCTWNEFLSRDAAQARMSYARPDATAPEPVAVSAGNTLITADVVRASFTAAGPQVGLYVDGAKGIMVACTYDSLRGRNHNKFTIYQHFVPAAGDTTTICASTSADTLTVDSAVYGSDTGSFTWYVPLPEGNKRFVGWYYIQLDSWGVITLRNGQISARGVW